MTAKSWVNMDAVRVRKPKPAQMTVGYEAPEAEAEFRRSRVESICGWRGGSRQKRWLEGRRAFGPVDCVYFIRMSGTDAYKIGYTHNVRARLSAIGAGIPVPVTLEAWVSFFDEAVLGEAELRAHELADFYGERLKGEWFNLKEHHITMIVDALTDGMADEVMGVCLTGETE